MFRLFLVTAFRSLLRHKVQSLINIASLALGLAVFGFTFIYVNQELSYDRAWPDAERIHRLVIEQRGIPGLRDGESTNVDARTYPQILDYFAPQIEKATRLTRLAARFKGAAASTRTNLTLADPEFLDIFQLEVVAGDLGRAFSGPGFIAIEENYAATLGTNVAPGERVTIQSTTGAELEYEVAAIYRLPSYISPSLRFNLLTLIHEYSLPLFANQGGSVPWENQIQVWLKLVPDVETKTFNAMQSTFIDQVITNYDQTLGPDQNIADHLFFRWQSVAAQHFNPVGFEAGNGSGDIARVMTFAVVGLLVLVVGCSNSISLSLASAIERQREIGVRKTMGALPVHILRQHLGESVVLALIALMPAIALLELLLPGFRALLPFTASISVGWNECALLALITIVVGLANGIYPAVVLSDVRPRAALQSGPGSKIGSGLNLRNLLVNAQFCFASMLLIGTAALYLQLAVTRSQPSGFNAENMVVIGLNSEQEQANGAALRAELEKIPGVVQVTAANVTPNANLPIISNTLSLVRQSNDIDELRPQMLIIDPGFFEALEIPLLAGRAPVPMPITGDQPSQNSAPDQPSAQPVAINRTAARALGFGSPEEAMEQTVFMRNTSGQNGQTSHLPIRITGVVEDNMYMSLRRMPGPEIYWPAPTDSALPLMLKYEKAIEDSLQERIQQTARKVNGQPLQFLRFIEPELRAAFRQEQNESRLLLICGGLALLLACIGLYGLAAFAIERRVKEVGVRKVMGASVSTIVALYLWRFSRPVLIANLLAWPFVIYFVLQWIERFPYQIDKAWLLPLCLGAAATVLVIALLTVTIITLRAAAAKPVQSLRYE